MKIYKSKKSFILGNALILIPVLILTIVVWLEGEAAQSGEWLGITLFWILALLIILLPLGSRLEVGDDYIKTYFFGLVSTKKISATDIQVLEYGNVFKGGFGFGKGINFRALRNGKSRAYSLSEKVYGKEAIAHARRVLDPKK